MSKAFSLINAIMWLLMAAYYLIKMPVVDPRYVSMLCVFLLIRNLGDLSEEDVKE